MKLVSSQQWFRCSQINLGIKLNRHNTPNSYNNFSPVVAVLKAEDKKSEVGT